MTPLELEILNQINKFGYLDTKKINYKNKHSIRTIKYNLIKQGYIQKSSNSRKVSWLTDKGKNVLNDTD